ncbi:MAG: CHAT domain-containing protein [Balneolaceae bacterium]|nr:CHAT domain-containing protein [Balneolaceae bacterium]MBO6545623.1 CHAT domain-containing protein [Balneolaceae bacterium]MBO6647019.1 CHAT domain-containing protein [Balneolaceae bacterium]
MSVKRLLILFILGWCSSGLVYAQDWIDEYDSFFEKGLQEGENSNWSGSASEFKQAYELALANNDTLRLLDAGIKYGRRLINMQELNKARLFLVDLQKFSSDKIPSSIRAQHEYTLGSATYRLGNFGEAAKHYERGLEVANPSSDSLLIANSSLYLSNVLLFSAEYERAHQLGSRAIELYEELKRPNDVSRANLFKYNIFLYEGDLNGGEPYLLKNYEYAQSTNNPSLLRDSYQYLSDFYNRKNEHSLAIMFSEKGLALAEELDQELYKTRYYFTLGDIYLKLGEVDRALSYYNRAHKYYESVGSTGLAIDILLKIAECYALKKDYQIAEPLLLDALEYYQDKNQFMDLGFTLDMLARIKLSTRMYDDALAYLQQNLKNSNEHGLPRTKTWTLEKLIQLPDSYFSKQEKLRLSKELFKTASSLEPELQIRAFKNYSYSFVGLNSDSAFHYAEEALALIEKKRVSFSEGTLKANIFAAHATYYNDVASWYAEIKNDYSSAFDLFESSKSRALLDQLAEARSKDLLTLSEETELLLLQQQKTVDRLYQQLPEATEEEITKLKDEITDVELEYDATIEQVRREHPAWNSFIYPETLSLNEVQELCDNTTGILEFAFLKSGLAIMLITSDEVFYHQITDQPFFKSDFTEKINRFRDAVINLAGTDSLERLSEPLYEQLFAPFEIRLAKLDYLVVVPDGSISLLPLDAIIHDGEYLVSRFTFKYLPSVSVFEQIQNPHRKTSQDLLAVAGSGFEQGNSIFDSRTQSSFAALPFTLIEVDTLAAKFQKNKVLKNNAVSETGIKNLTLESFKYIHFATHGHINETVPNQSGLILSKKNELEQLFGEDGLLNATEIRSLNIHADMVVLSACNTGAGKVVNGEGLLGLQRSFLVAGASSVVASLWSIYDRSTPLLISRFYEKLIEYEDREFGWFDKLLVWADWYKPELVDYKTLALRDAKLEMLEHPYYNHPVHWASFTITGK